MDKKMMWSLLALAIEKMTIEDVGIIRVCCFGTSQLGDKERVIRSLKYLHTNKYLLGCCIPHQGRNCLGIDVCDLYSYEGPIYLGIPTYSGYSLEEKLRSEVLADSPTIQPTDILLEGFYRSPWD